MPYSSLFSLIKAPQDKQEGFFLDMANIFHTLPLLPPLWDLFPLPVVRFGDLPTFAAHAVLAQLQLPHLSSDTLTCPSQSTVPMGFTWYVVIAHALVSSIVKAAFKCTLQLSAFLLKTHFRPSMSLFQPEAAPFFLTETVPLALVIVDDISVLFNNLNDDDVRSFHALLRNILGMTGLPVSEDKSLLPQKVEGELIPFLGCNIDLVKRMFLPIPDKISKIAAFVYTLQLHEPIPLRKWESLTGNFCFMQCLIGLFYLHLKNCMKVPLVASGIHCQFPLQKTHLLLLLHTKSPSLSELFPLSRSQPSGFTFFS